MNSAEWRATIAPSHSRRADEAGSGETREEFYRLLQLEGAYRAGLAGLKQFLRTIGGPDE